MTNPLLGCDPKEVSPARAGAVFSEFAKKLSTKSGIGFNAAWSRAKLLHPDLHARLGEKTHGADSALIDSAGTGKSPKWANQPADSFSL